MRFFQALAGVSLAWEGVITAVEDTTLPLETVLAGGDGFALPFATVTAGRDGVALPLATVRAGEDGDATLLVTAAAGWAGDALPGLATGLTEPSTGVTVDAQTSETARIAVTSTADSAGAEVPAAEVAANFFQQQELPRKTILDVSGA